MLLWIFAVVFRQQPVGTAEDRRALDCDVLATLRLPDIEQCLAIDPVNVELLVKAGDGYAGTGDPARAESLYRRALAIDPFDGGSHLRLGELLLSKGDRDSAAREAAAALASHPGSPAAESLAARTGLAVAKQASQAVDAKASPGPSSSQRP
ncbi:MAG TPA: tetratricopeptide repeat protein [Vicinamibacterales bacterium]|nr:tetratricopeptide repeat protein [Vicinamibacterales bacterium]